MVEPLAQEIVFDRLHKLIKKGDLIATRGELAAGVDPSLRNRFGWTLLMLAALHGRGDIVELLVQSGADARSSNQFGDTAETLAISKGHHSVAQTLRNTTHE